MSNPIENEEKNAPKRIGGGGILKLDANTMNEIVSKSKNISLNEDAWISAKNNNNQHIHKTSDRREKYFETTNPDERKDLNYKVLFNPDDPDLPIYIGKKETPSPRRSQLEARSKPQDGATTSEFSKYYLPFI
jgi:hypothetical protein